MKLQRLLGALALLGVCMAQTTAPATKTATAPRPFDHGDDVDFSKYKYVEGVTVPAKPPERLLAKAELKDKIYHGVLLNTDTQAGFEKRYKQYVDTVGKKPTMIGCFHARWSKGVEQPEKLFADRLKVIDSVPNVVPFIKLYTGDWQPKGPIMKADDILEGKEDGYFMQMAKMSKEFGKPFLLSINHEMNGDWFKFSELYKKDGGTDWTAEKYILVWRRIHKLFQEAGADNVAFVWSPAVNGRKFKQYDSVNSHKAYYPGDEFVDWIGPSFYNDVNHKYFDSIAAAYPTKPIVLAEWGTEPHRGAWYLPKPYPGDAKWMQATFDIFPKRYPNMKAFTYFYWGKDVDIERVPEQVEIYRKGIAGEKFLSN